MSFWVSVIRADDLDWSNSEGERLLYAEFPSEDERKVALERWLEESSKLHLFQEFLGGDATIGVYWSDIARELGLPMLASLHENGLKLATANQLEDLEQELDVLEAHWDSHDEDLHDDVVGHRRQCVGEGMGNLREAIDIAKAYCATLVIG